MSFYKSKFRRSLLIRRDIEPIEESNLKQRDHDYHAFNSTTGAAFSLRMLSNGTTKPSSSSNTNNTSNNNHFGTNIFSSSSTMLPSAVKTKLIKNFGRTKEKFLEGIGKLDRTSDQNFDIYVEQFERQHAQASKLNKELNKYMSSLREMQKSSKSFYDTLKESYEIEWPASGEFQQQIDMLELKWMEYINKLNKDIQMPLVSYLNEFPELKKKIEKRHNRLLDYDNARHNLQNAQNKSLKKQQQQAAAAAAASANTLNPNQTTNSTGSSNSSSNGSSGPAGAAMGNYNTKSATDQLTKLTKLKIDLEDKQHIYEEINQTLCLSLPVLYENRVKFYASLFQTFFHAETNFHSECVESKSKLDELCENLSITTLAPSSSSAPPISTEETNGSHENGYHVEPISRPPVPPPKHHIEAHNIVHENGSNGHVINKHQSPLSLDHEQYKNIADIEEEENDHESTTVRHQTTTTSTSIVGTNGGRILSHNFDYDKSNNSELNGTSSKLNGDHSQETDTSKLNGGGETNHTSEANKLSDEEDEDKVIVEEFVQETVEHVVKDLKESSSSLSTSIKENGINGESVTVLKSNNSSPKLNDTNNNNKEVDNSNKFLFKVRATYPYDAKEVDELSFGKDDTIIVVEGSESEREDLDDGWLIGIHEVTKRRGLFPENFTKRI